jgi:hypothetical protein
MAKPEKPENLRGPYCSCVVGLGEGGGFAHLSPDG